MADDFLDYFEQRRRHVVDTCTACGECVRACPMLARPEFADLEPEAVQSEIRSFLAGGPATAAVFRRVFSCMGCYGCCEVCPEGLDAQQVNELVKARYRREGLERGAYVPSRDPEAVQRVLAAVQLTADDYRRLFTPAPRRPARFVFFPGCNVYAQPDRLLEALDIIALTAEEVAFLPGLDHCCGDMPLFMGDVPEAAAVGAELVSALAAYEPETVVFWCPTCLCRFHTTISQVRALPFATESLAQFLAARIERLTFAAPVREQATLHEACKVALTGLDRDGPRPLLAQVPGLEIVEMPRRREEAACCGCGAETWFRDVFEEVRDERLREAQGTGAELLIDVCHYCHHLFTPEAARFGLVAENCIHVLARSLGVAREDRYAAWRRQADAERVLTEAAAQIATAPFSRETIEAVVRAQFTG
jgi:heterodisulfide reductase subunit D